jgi:hypothetical protein
MAPTIEFVREDVRRRAEVLRSGEPSGNDMQRAIWSQRNLSKSLGQGSLVYLDVSDKPAEVKPIGPYVVPSFLKRVHDKWDRVSGVPNGE